MHVQALRETTSNGLRDPLLQCNDIDIQGSKGAGKVRDVCFTTMLSQIQEMLWIEKGGEAQITDELAAYNPLIPQGQELVATMMFEIADETRRQSILSRLGGVEEMVTLEIDGQKISAVPEREEGIERTRRDGKTSSVHFLHFPFQADLIETFRKPGTRIVAAIEHKEYAHMAVLPEAMRQALAEDFD